MDVTYMVTVKGLPPNYAFHLKDMLEKDLLFYPKRLKMGSISVEEVRPKVEAKPEPKPKEKPKGPPLREKK